MRAIDVVQAYCDAWMAGDVATVASMYHEDLTLEWFGEHRLAGTHVGLQRSIEALLELQAATNRTPTEIVEILDGPSSVVAIVNERWTSANGDHVFEHVRALEFTVHENKLHTCRIFETAQARIDEWLG